MKKELKNEDFSASTLLDYLMSGDLFIEVFEHFEDELIEVEHNLVDNKLIYTSDFWKTLQEYTNPIDLLHGDYTLDNLIEDMLNDLSVEEKLVDLIDYVGKNEMIEFINSI